MVCALSQQDISQGVSFAPRLYGPESDISTSAQTSANVGRLGQAIGGLIEFSDHVGTGTKTWLAQP
jgi:hypothetical protein